jgi:NUMOD4 motif/HNH endonuclease
VPVTAERWRPIPRWPGYEVSDLGRVRSVDRVLSDGRQASGRLLTPTADGSGYARVTLSDGRRRQTAAVHVLVCEAFHGPRPRRKEVLHGTGGQQDNRAVNLRWGTRGRNEKDKGKHRRKRMSHLVTRRLGRL